MKLRILAGAIALSLSLTFAPPLAADSRVDVIVTPADGFTAIDCARVVAERFPDARVHDIYDTVLDGFALSIGSDSLAMLSSLEPVGSVELCGSFEPASLGTSEPSRSDDYTRAISELIGLTSELNYDGDGVIVAVIDSGFDVTHPAFTDGELTPTLTESALAEIIDSRALYSAKRDATLADVFRSDKLPYVYDYSGDDPDVSSAISHGTHVAGIIGARPTDKSDMQGIAPKAQLALMKVFDDSGSAASEHVLISAIDDAVRLGADVINLSLGQYCGSVNHSSTRALSLAVKRANDAGCVVVCAAGNESTSADDSRLAADGVTSLPTALYTDYGTLNYPGSLDGTIAVASVSSGFTFARRFLCGELSVNFTDTNRTLGVIAEDFDEYFDSQTLEFVPIPGLGEDSDYAGLDLSGKLALIERGVLTFAEKANIAASHGAVGAIIYDNTDSPSFTMDVTDALIPAISISREDGEALIASGERTLSFDYDLRLFASDERAGDISKFSSFGATPELTLKPELAGVGGGVFSTVEGGYEGSSGTSMAAPQIAGAAALICEMLDSLENPPSEGERAAIVKSRLMNTAVPVLQDNGVAYSPRSQGAGLIDLEAALTTPLAISYAPTGGAKAELADFIGEVLYLDVVVENLTDSPLDAELSVSLTGDGYELVKIGDSDVPFSTTLAEPDRTSLITSLGDGSLNLYAEDFVPLALTLEPREKRTIPLEISLDADYSDKLDAIFENGRFIEGFVFVTSGDMQVSMPYMGYHGDWSAAPILDADIYSGKTSMFGGSELMIEVAGERTSAGAVPGKDYAYSYEFIAFSPNGDGEADEIVLHAEFLRNAVFARLEILDSDGAKVYSDSYALYMQKRRTIDEPKRLIFEWDGSDGIFSRYRLPDGEYKMVYTFTLDYLTEQAQTYTFPVIVDTKAPELLSYSVENGILTVRAREENALRSICVNDGDNGSFRLESLGERTSDGDFTASFELGECDRFYIELVDCAYNSHVELVKLG